MKDISKTILSNAYIVFPKMENFTLFIKTFQIPSFNVGQTQIPRPQRNHWQVPSVHSTVEQITIMFFCDENYKNYFFILDWLNKTRYAVDVTEVMTDAVVVVLNNHKKPIINVNLEYCWPTSLSEIDFDISNTDVIMPFVTFQVDQISYQFLDGSLSGKF